MDQVIVTKEKLDAIAASIIDTVLKKNHDYGGSWQSAGPLEPLLRIYVKSMRYIELGQHSHALVTDETVYDTLRDVIGYALLTLLWNEEHHAEEEEDHQEKGIAAAAFRDGKVLRIMPSKESR